MTSTAPQTAHDRGDRAFELFKLAEDQRAVRPGTVARDIEIVASRLGPESRRTVRRDPVSELAVRALKPAGGVGFGWPFLFTPLALRQE